MKARLPDNIQAIQVAFNKGEGFVHSITFEGDSVLTIGAVDTENTDDDLKKGRVERFTLQEGQTLLGCQLYHDDWLRGVRFMTWQQPVVDDPLEEEPEPTAIDEKCACTDSEAKDGICSVCSKAKKVITEGVTCDKGDELMHRVASDDAPKQWCDRCAKAIYGGDEYYACYRADIDCQYRCCQNCIKYLLFMPGKHCNQGHPLKTVNPASPEEDGSPGRPTCSCHLCGQAIESTHKYFSHCRYNCCAACFKGKEKPDLNVIL